MRITNRAGLLLVAAAASLALGGCTKTKIKDSTIENPGPQHQVIVAPPGSSTTVVTPPQ